MTRRDQCQLHKRINCIFCTRPKPKPPKKDWLTRLTPIRQKSAKQEQIDRLSRLLKRAVLLRDKYRCVRCGKPHTEYPAWDGDILDPSHIFTKSVWPLARFFLLNVKALCRECHNWWHESADRADKWIRWYLGPRKYQELLAAVTNPDPMFRDFTKVEAYLKQEIRKYS